MKLSNKWLDWLLIPPWVIAHLKAKESLKSEVKMDFFGSLSFQACNLEPRCLNIHETDKVGEVRPFFYWWKSLWCTSSSASDAPSTTWVIPDNHYTLEGTLTGKMIIDKNTLSPMGEHFSQSSHCLSDLFLVLKGNLHHTFQRQA